MKRQSTPSDAYRAGMSDLRSAASRHGTTNLSPSIAQREEWRHAWGEYMRGWNAEKRAKNPAKFDRCVKAVKKRGGAANAYAVCTAAGTRGNPRSRRKAAKQNPAEAAAEAFQEFHGRPSEEVVTVTRKIHYHGHLAALGKLEALHGIAVNTGEKVTLADFNGAVLCENETKDQLFIEGGDQRVDLKVFGIDTPHELNVLMDVRVVEYFTTKKHLGRDGGTAIYVHKFSRNFPELIYDRPNKQLLFAGGQYSMPPEGIDH